MKRSRIYIYMLAVCVVLGWHSSLSAAGFFSVRDTEKPKPEFQRNGNEISANFIPRAKSTRVTISFGVKDDRGILESVKGVDFESVAHSNVDVKNFKSAVFEIQIGNLKPGGSASVWLQSDFFSSATAFYVYNPNREKPWMDAGAENRPYKDRIRELLITVSDGGEFDADGAVDGRVRILGGPRDSFWGYALGTLFIRFFGIFIVLSILMVGMILSGFIFKALERRKAKKDANQKDPIKAKAPAESDAAVSLPEADQEVDAVEETVAAIGVALHLHLSSSHMAKAPAVDSGPDSSWIWEGRHRIMNDRLSVFNRSHR